MKNQSGWQRHRWRMLGWGMAVMMLLAPGIAMRFTDEVVWNLSDFIVFGVMLVAIGGAFELAVRKTHNTTYRTAIALALAGAFFTAWVNGAVGIIGNEDHPANLMYSAVIGIGIIGAVVARCQPKRMAQVMALMVTAYLLVPVVGLASGLNDATGLAGTYRVTGIICALWLASAWLFSRTYRSAAD